MAAPRYDTHPAPAADTRPRHRNGHQDQAEPSGYTLEEIDKLARTAIAGKLIPGIDASDAYESAWFAIVETLYTHTTSEPPWPGRLVWDARQALQRLVETERHHHGLVQRGGTFGRNFERYWDSGAVARARDPTARAAVARQQPARLRRELAAPRPRHLPLCELLQRPRRQPR